LVPPRFVKECQDISHERASHQQRIHVIRNCPLDPVIPELDPEDPVTDKHLKKNRFISEAFLELFAQLTITPLLSYETRNQVDFFTDVIAIKKYSGQLTGFSDSELVFHNDRTAHKVRADYITLLGMRCPDDDLIYTGYIDGADIVKNLEPAHIEYLRQPHFFTVFDVFSRDMNKQLSTSKKHPILSNTHSIRYLDTMTCVAPEAPLEARDAFIAFKNAMTRSQCKRRHRILTGDLLTFANQDGLHNREKIDILNPESASSRWLTGVKRRALIDMNFSSPHNLPPTGTLRSLIQETMVCPPSRGLFFACCFVVFPRRPRNACATIPANRSALCRCCPYLVNA
jgi:L-asparagine oxygenase